MYVEKLKVCVEYRDRVVLAEIMGSREVNTIGVYRKDLARKIEGCVWFDDSSNNNFDGIVEYIKENAKDGDLVITLGCGDIYKANKRMVREFGE